MTTYTRETLPGASPNPVTRFAVVAEPGDTFDGITCNTVEITGPTANPAAFRRVTLSGFGDTWTTDYPNRA